MSYYFTDGKSTFDASLIDTILAQYEEITERYDITVIDDKEHMQHTNYLDFKLNFLYQLKGMDGIQSVAELESLYQRGIRSVAFIFEESNHLAQSYKNPNKEGLTDFGRDCIDFIEQHAMILDVAHMNHESMMQCYQYGKNHIINSHTNIHGLYQDSRNVLDEFLATIAHTEGVVGLSLSSELLNGPGMAANIDDYCAQIEYVRKLI